MSVVRRFIGLLLERWAWWVVPIVVMFVLTVLVLALGRGPTVAPFDYGIDPAPASRTGVDGER